MPARERVLRTLTSPREEEHRGRQRQLRGNDRHATHRIRAVRRHHPAPAGHGRPLPELREAQTHEFLRGILRPAAAADAIANPRAHAALAAGALRYVPSIAYAHPSAPSGGRIRAPRRRVLAGFAFAAAALGIPAPAGAVDVVRSSYVPGSTFDVRPASRGADVLWAKGRTGDLRLSRTRWPGGARPFAGRPAVPAPSGPAVLSGRIAYVARKAFPRGQRTILVTALDTTSGRSRTTVVARPPSPTTELRIHAGGGAVAVSYLEGGRRRDQRLQWVVKPPGAATFRAPRVIEGPRDPYDYRYELALGPDGSGALLTGPYLSDAPGEPLRVRRLNRQGVPGPWAQIGSEGYRGSTLSLALSARGTVAIAVAADVVGDAADPLPGRTQLLAASLPARSSTPTPPQLLADLGGDGSISGEETRVAIGAGELAVVSSASSFPGAVLAFQGPPHTLSLAARFPVREPGGITPAIARDGGAFLVWTPAQPREWVAPPVMAASLAPGKRTFGRSAIVARSRVPKWFFSIGARQLVPVGRSRAVLSFSDESIDDARHRLAELKR